MKTSQPHAVKHYREIWTRIKKDMNDLKEDININFNELLCNLIVTEGSFKLALGLSLSSSSKCIVKEGTR